MTIAAANFFAAMTGGPPASTMASNAPTGFATAIGSALATPSPVVALTGPASLRSIDPMARENTSLAATTSPLGAMTSMPVATVAAVAAPATVSAKTVSADTVVPSIETPVDPHAPSSAAVQASRTSPSVATPQAAQAEPNRSAVSGSRPEVSAEIDGPVRDVGRGPRTMPIDDRDPIEVAASEAEVASDEGEVAADEGEVAADEGAGPLDKPPVPSGPPGAPDPQSPLDPQSPVVALAATLPTLATTAARSTSPTREGLAVPEEASDSAEDLVEVAGGTPTLGPAVALTTGTASSSSMALEHEPRLGTALQSSATADRQDGKVTPPGQSALAPDMQASATTFADRMTLPGETRPAGQAAPGAETSLFVAQPAPAASLQTRPLAAFASVPPASSPDQPSPDQPSIDARPGRIGREMGVEIARRVGSGLGAGGDELTVRLNPIEMGRIEVRLSFDERGTLRVGMAAESAAALDMLRRDSAELSRSLADAGVRADANSLRFDTRSGQDHAGQGGTGQFWQRHSSGGGSARGGSQPTSGQGIAGDGTAGEDLTYRPLRMRGRINLMA